LNWCSLPTFHPASLALLQPPLNILHLCESAQTASIMTILSTKRERTRMQHTEVQLHSCLQLLLHAHSLVTVAGLTIGYLNMWCSLVCSALLCVHSRQIAATME
jgi:hypothetical protein